MYQENHTRRIGVAVFGNLPEGQRVNRESEQQRIRAVLMTYCDPKVKFDGMSAWEVAGKILDVLGEGETDAN